MQIGEAIKSRPASLPACQLVLNDDGTQWPVLNTGKSIHSMLGIHAFSQCPFSMPVVYAFDPGGEDASRC